MADIILRTAGSIASANATVKGSPLTNFEVDNNFSNINIVVDSLSNVFSTTTGQATITGNLLPATANTFDLGSPALPFRDLYLDGNSVHLGGLVLSSVGGNIALDGTQVLSATGGAVPADASIDAAKLATGAVTEDKIGTGAVSAAKLAATSGSGNVVLDTAATLTNIQLTDGNVTSPAITFGSDTNTGIFRDGADNLVITTGGVARANINSSGFFEANFKDKVIALGDSGTSQTIDLSLGTAFTTTLTGNCTFTISNAEIGSSFVLQVTNDGTPGRSLALAGGTNFRFPFGAIGRSTEANEIDIWYFTTFDGGTNWIVALPVKSAATV